MAIQSQKDKGIDIKARLWQESRWIPNSRPGCAILPAPVYLIVNIWLPVNVLGRLILRSRNGLGNMAESGNISNPFCELKDAWCQRSSDFSGRGGKFEVNKMFHGAAALLVVSNIRR